jgi:hypothetical protein
MVSGPKSRPNALGNSSDYRSNSAIGRSLVVLVQQCNKFSQFHIF